MQDLNNLSPEVQSATLGNNYVINKMSKDMNFVGLFTIIYGAFNCITIIGAVFGIPLIFMGLRIRESANMFEVFNRSGDQSALNNALEKQSKYFYIQKVLIILTIVLFIIYIIVIISFFSFFSSWTNDPELYSFLVS